MRGRVGGAGQEAYCLLFTNGSSTQKRLTDFSKTHDGMKLAEQDLQRRGAGDIFGMQQHGFDELQFASWTNLTLITTAKHLSEEITQKNIPWKPFLTIKKVDENKTPM